MLCAGTRRRGICAGRRAGEDAIGRPANEIVGHTDRDLFPDNSDGYEDRDNETIASP